MDTVHSQLFRILKYNILVLHYTIPLCHTIEKNSTDPPHKKETNIWCEINVSSSTIIYEAENAVIPAGKQALR